MGGGGRPGKYPKTKSRWQTLTLGCPLAARGSGFLSQPHTVALQCLDSGLSQTAPEFREHTNISAPNLLSAEEAECGCQASRAGDEPELATKLRMDNPSGSPRTKST